MKKGSIIVLSGPSGVGKGTLRAKLDYDKLNLVNSVSWTTRKPRQEDIEGVTYHFVSQEEFEQNIKEDGFAEYAGFSSHAYGTPKKELEAKLEAGKNVMLEIEVQGALQVMDKYPEALSIFILPPSLEELEKRLVGRNSEDDAAIQQRLARAKEELALQDRYRFKVVNDNLDRAVQEIEKIIQENAPTNEK